LQRTPCDSDDHLSACSQCRQAFTLADKNGHTQFIFELPDLLADTGLRCEQRIGGDRHIQTVIDYCAKVTELLKVHFDLVITLR